jgi:hypothetical protein
LLLLSIKEKKLNERRRRKEEEKYEHCCDMRQLILRNSIKISGNLQVNNRRNTSLQ